MPNLDTSFASRLQLNGAAAIRSSVVDIYPLSAQTSIKTFKIDPSIPGSMGLKEEADYLNALRDERNFQFRLDNSLPELPESDDITANHQFFVERGLGHLGVRDLVFDGCQITGSHCVVPHPAYSTFNQHKHMELRTFGANLGVAGILVTQDNKLIIQHRSPSNRVYGDVPGASVAGLVSAKGFEVSEQLDLTKVAVIHLLSEGQEEIGLSPSVNESIQLTGFLVDKIALHNELTFSIRTQLTAETIAENALKNRQAQNGANFKENIVVFDATSYVIERLLTEIHSPFPTTHAGPLLMLGQELAYREGKDGAAWLQDIKKRMDKNYARVDSMCQGKKYNPNKNSISQGLPSFKAELDRLFKDEHSYYACAWDPE